MVFVKDPTLPYEQKYYEIWQHKDKKPAETDYAPYGIGQILKFLLIGDYSVIDFCSTTVIPYGDGQFKICRRPDRMDPLIHYSRQAVKFNPSQLKQYYKDLAYALDDAHQQIPFYHDYAVELYQMAKRIYAAPSGLMEGRKRIMIADDGHRKVAHDDDYDAQYFNYGHEYIEGLRFRHSTNKCPHYAVREHLARHFNIGMVDILAQRTFIRESRLFDPVAALLPQE